MLIAKYMHPDNGYEFERLDASQLLQLNQEYEVEFVDMGGFHTDIYLVDFKKSFNSVLFDFFEDGKEIDIYHSPKYNPYLWED